jgi:hypothetical protein
MFPIMIRFLARSVAALALLSLNTARADDTIAPENAFFGTFGERMAAWLSASNLLPWAGGCLAVIAVTLLVGHRFRLARRKARIDIAGLRNGPRFRLVDTMCHAVWKGRKIDEARLTRALQIARDITQMDFTSDHLREIALRADRLIVPTNFYWMRGDLTRSERMVIFNATVSVLLADGPLTRSDRAFLRTVARGLGLRDDDLRDLAHLIWL